MPELPEVETMVRGLRPALVGMGLRAVEVRDPKILHGGMPEEFRLRESGEVVAAVGRRGKWVVLTLGGGGIIVIQPRMTGGFRLEEPDRPEHVRLVFHLEKPGRFVWFCDTRRLGRIAYYRGIEEADEACRKSQGPDALEIGRDDLASRLKKTRRGIKPTLMDQKVLAGVGNIYADEILFRARLHPLRIAATLKAAEVSRLHEVIAPTLLEAIEAEGSSFDAGYRTVLGLEGGFLAQNAMYGRGGKPCPGCAGPIVKTKIAGLIGRPTHFCPTCQPAPGRKKKRNFTAEDAEIAEEKREN